MAALTPSTQAEDNPVDILLVDSRQLVQAGIERVLSDSGHLTVSDAAANCNEAIRLARRQQPQIIMINLPASSVEVLDGAGKILRQFPDVPVLVLADESDLIMQERLLRAGVAGCVSSLCSVEELFAAIETVLKGERYISDSLARKLAERRLPGREGSPFDQLTHRELQVFLLVAEGNSTLAIAKQLCVTRKTVNGYRNRVLEKLHMQTEVGLMHLAIRHGLVKVDGAV
ncbi:MAG: response regulator transcription factor [Thiogranum sp.]